MFAFNHILKEYGKLSGWAIVGGAPFVGAFASLAPPWPPGIAGITAVAQLIILILVYQILSSSKRSTANKVVVATLVMLIFASMAYAILYILFTTQLLNSSERIVRGFTCTRIALHQFGDKCPWLGALELNEIQNRAQALWTELSLLIANVSLITSWMMAFMALAGFVGSFIIYQRRWPVAMKKRPQAPRTRGLD